MVMSCVDHKSRGLRKGNAVRAGEHTLTLLFLRFLAIQNGGHGTCRKIIERVPAPLGNGDPARLVGVPCA